MREELNRLMKEYELSKGDVCRIVCVATHKSCSVRAVRSWLADPAKAYAKPCPEWVVSTLSGYLESGKSIPRLQTERSEMSDKYSMTTMIVLFIFSIAVTAMFSAMITINLNPTLENEECHFKPLILQESEFFK